jgi:uncharacterized protein
MKRCLSFLLVLALTLGLLAVPAFAADVVSAPDAENGVYYVDDAACLSFTTKDYIDRQNIALTNACGGQVAVVTLDFLNDLDCEEYAYEVLNQWGVGDADKNNGTVFVLVTGEKKCWITSGSGIEDDLSAGTLENILESYCYDSLDSGEYDTAVYDTVQAIFGWYENYYNVNLANYSSTQVENGEPGFGGGSVGRTVLSVIQSILSLILTIVVLVIILGAIFGASRSPSFWCFGPTWCGPRGPRGPRHRDHHDPHHDPHHGPGPRGGGFGGGFGGGGHGGGGFGGGFGGGHGGGGFGGGGGHGGGAGRR